MSISEGAGRGKNLRTRQGPRKRETGRVRAKQKNSDGFFFVSKPTLKKTPRGQIKEPKGGENERKLSDQWQANPPDASNPNLCKQILKFKGTELKPHANPPPLRAKIRVETVQINDYRYG